MGTQQSQPQPPPIPDEPQQISPFQRWNLSDHTPEDLSLLLTSTIQWRQCHTIISTFLKNVTNRDRYQNCVSVVLQHLKREEIGLEMREREKIFEEYYDRLAYSFFVADDFHQHAINYAITPKDKLLFLYQYYSLNQQLLLRALYLNFPQILLSFPQFITHLLQTQIIIKNITHLLRMIIQYDKLQLLRESSEESGRFMGKERREEIQEDLGRVFYGIEKVYMNGAAVAVQWGNGELAGVIMGELVRKGYKLGKEDYQYYLKIQLYNMFIYQLGKLNLSFPFFSQKSLPQLLHLFYSTHPIESTPLLLNHFNIYGPTSQSHKLSTLLQYSFSQQAHLSTFIRLLQYKFIQLKWTKGQFTGVVNKIVGGRCQIGRYGEVIRNVVEGFQGNVDRVLIEKAKKLVNVVQCLHLFNINISVEQVHPLVYQNPKNIDNQSLMLYQQNAINIFKMLVHHFIKDKDISDRSITIQGQNYPLANLYDFLVFITFCRKYIVNQAISINAVHTILFKELIKEEYYQEIQVLLSQKHLETYSISFQAVQMLIIDHLINLLTRQRIKNIENTVNTIFSILKLTLKSNPPHFLASYYRYFKYLEDKDLSLPLELKQDVSLNHFYFLLEKYQNKIDSIDFDYLFEQMSSIQQNCIEKEGGFQAVVTDEYLKFKVALSNRLFAGKKGKIGSQIIEDVMRYQPPWLSSELINILRSNPKMDPNFINIVFQHCNRGEDLQYILSLHSKEQQSNSQSSSSSSKLSLKNLKKLNELIKQDHFIVLDNQLILNETQYTNLVAQLTFGKDDQMLAQYKLFFKLLSTQPQRAFNYALNYCKKDSMFSYVFIMEAAKRNVINLENALPLLVRFFYWKVNKGAGNRHVGLKEYNQVKMTEIVKYEGKGEGNREDFIIFGKTVKNYQASLVVTPQFLNLYINEASLFKFMTDEAQRKRLILQLRQNPMSKSNSKILRNLCQLMSVDIIDLSLYQLIGRVNSREEIDEQAWTIVQKLIFWGEDRGTVMKVVNKIRQKVQVLEVVVRILEYLRESGPVYGQVITEEHISIISSLAAIEKDNNLFGIIPDTFFQRPIGVYHNPRKGVLSQTHRRILEQSAAMTNIFVISKALYFMYGCDEKIEKVVLGEFSLKQDDSEEFQTLRKKIKNDVN